MKEHYALVIVGAGPAGMAAAIQAAEFGLEVALLDEQPVAGGQIYRNVDDSSQSDRKFLGQDYLRGRSLVQQFTNSNVDYFSAASVWNLNHEREVSVLINDKNYCFSADQVIICTGAQERPMPVRGWELPGVMTAGAGQILLKSGGMVPTGEVVLAGSGPLLLLLGWQYIGAGVVIKAILDTAPKHNIKQAMVKFPQALRTPKILQKGLSLKMAIKRAGVPYYKIIQNISAHGGDRLGEVRFKSRGVVRKISTSTLLLHNGIIPQLHLAMVAGCEVKWNEMQVCWQVTTDQWGQTSIQGIFAAGDSQAIMGAGASRLQGQLCALKALGQSGKIDQAALDRLSLPVRKSLRREMAIRPFLDTLYRPAPWLILPPDDVIVCRCEEVCAGEIRKLADLGCQGPNQAKAFSRCGMGPCQGRQCSDTVSAIIAAKQGRSMDEVGYFRIRPPIKPVTLGQL